MNEDTVIKLITNMRTEITTRLSAIEARLDSKTEKNGKQNLAIQENSSRLTVLEKRGAWSNKKAALWMVTAALIGAVIGNIDKIAALF